MNRLSKADVDRLLSNPSADTRADLAGRIAALWRDRDLGPNERRLADEIIRQLLQDIDVSVRLALSQTLKTDPNLPHDVAMTLVGDLDEVAVPMLSTSLVFSEADLIEVVRTRGPACQVAIAARASVPVDVASALVDTGDETVAATLMRNEGAVIDEPLGAKVLDIYSGSELVIDSMAQRRHVPLRLAERLTGIVAENLRRRLRRDGAVSADKVDDMVDWSRERSLIDMINEKTSDEELLDLCDQLGRRERLTPGLLLRALCLGKMRCFEAAMAVIAAIDLYSAQVLVRDTGKHGFRSLCVVGGLPEMVYDVGRFAVRVGYLHPDAGPGTKRRFRLAIAARYGEAAETLADDELLRYLAKLPSHPVEPEEPAPLRVVGG
ncbi:MAG: DUF2336 domain-containing protein [Alphaproteobacteria bacterium]